MTYFPSYENIRAMSQLQMSKWDLFEPYMEFIDRLMDYEAGPTRAEKEIIAAFVSRLNTCDFCFGAHKNVCMAFGVDEERVARRRFVEQLGREGEQARTDEPLLGATAVRVSAPQQLARE